MTYRSLSWDTGPALIAGTIWPPSAPRRPCPRYVAPGPAPPVLCSWLGWHTVGSVPAGYSDGPTRAASSGGGSQQRSDFQSSEDPTTFFWEFIKFILVHTCCWFKPISFQGMTQLKKEKQLFYFFLLTRGIQLYIKGWEIHYISLTSEAGRSCFPHLWHVFYFIRLMHGLRLPVSAIPFSPHTAC